MMDLAGFLFPAFLTLAAPVTAIWAFWLEAAKRPLTVTGGVAP